MKKKEDFCRESNHFLKSLGLALCLVSFGGSAIYASSLYAQRTMLSIQMNDRTVEDVFEYIEKNSEFIFVYHGSNIDLHRKVNLDIRDQSVEIILDKLFSGTDIEYIINNRQIIVRRDTKKEDLPIASQQTKKVKITGVVKDAHCRRAAPNCCGPCGWSRWQSGTRPSFPAGSSSAPHWPASLPGGRAS